MQLGISTGTFFLREKTEDAAEIIRALGFKVCETFLTTHFEYKQPFVTDLKNRLEGVKVHSLHTLTMQFEPELFSRYERVREDAEEVFITAAKAAKTLGASYYIMHGAARLKRLPYIIDYSLLASQLERLQSILALHTDGKTRIAYENVHWAFYNTAEFFNNLKPLSPVLTCLDIKQAMQSKVPLADYINADAGRIACVHIDDFDENGKLFLPGRGKFDFVTFFKQLADTGYDGPIMLELYAKDYNEYSELTHAAEYLFECAAKARVPLTY